MDQSEETSFCSAQMSPKHALGSRPHIPSRLRRLGQCEVIILQPSTVEGTVSVSGELVPSCSRAWSTARLLGLWKLELLDPSDLSLYPPSLSLHRAAL